MKWLVFLVAAVIGFLVTFGFSNRDEIGAEVNRKLDEDFVAQCVARAQFPALARMQRVPASPASA